MANKVIRAFWLFLLLFFIFLVGSMFAGCATPYLRGDFGIAVPEPPWKLIVTTASGKKTVVGEFNYLDNCLDSGAKFKRWSNEWRIECREN